VASALITKDRLAGALGAPMAHPHPYSARPAPRPQGRWFLEHACILQVCLALINYMSHSALLITSDEFLNS
jgi:hypothetical protein